MAMTGQTDIMACDIAPMTLGSSSVIDGWAKEIGYSSSEIACSASLT